MKKVYFTTDPKKYNAEVKVNDLIWRDHFSKLKDTLGHEEASRLAHIKITEYRKLNPFPVHFPKGNIVPASMGGVVYERLDK